MSMNSAAGWVHVPEDTLLLQLGRRDLNYRFDARAIPIPEGYIDLSAAYGKPPNLELYEITGFTSYIALNKNATYGHYTSYIKKGDIWYKCDDSRVSEAELKEAQKQVYLLALSKVKPHASMD